MEVYFVLRDYLKDKEYAYIAVEIEKMLKNEKKRMTKLKRNCDKKSVLPLATRFFIGFLFLLGRFDFV